MDQESHCAFIWSVADLLRGDCQASDYGKVALPVCGIAPAGLGANCPPLSGRPCLAFLGGGNHMALIEFDTRHYPRLERSDAARETCAALANMAPDIADDGMLRMAMRVRLLPGVSVAAVECSPLGVHRSARQLADGNDDALLFLNPGGPKQTGGDGRWVVRQRGLGLRGEMASASGAGCLALNERAGGIDFHGHPSK
ncbi:hypothetical protein [Diaphorobacter sp.]|uniref:hypothetical protein n=1 Tax=Diaphorobacter sp. TaxID=1934310 RepID=UPI003D119E1B